MQWWIARRLFSVRCSSAYGSRDFIRPTSGARGGGVPTPLGRCGRGRSPVPPKACRTNSFTRVLLLNFLGNSVNRILDASRSFTHPKRTNVSLRKWQKVYTLSSEFRYILSYSCVIFVTCTMTHLCFTEPGKVMAIFMQTQWIDRYWI